MTRIYMPEEVFWRRPEESTRLLGSRREIRGTRIYSIIATGRQKDAIPAHLEDIGQVSTDRNVDKIRENALNFTFNPSRNHLDLVRLHNEDDRPVEETIQLILYNQKSFSHLVDSVYEESEFNSELMHLAKLVSLHRKRSSRAHDLHTRWLNQTVDTISRILGFLSFAVLPLNWAFKSTAVAQHFREWKMIYNSSGARGNSARKLLPIVIDVMLGMAIMWIISRNTSPAEYLMTVTHEIIVYLRRLLEGLRGSPVGLKVNVHLNDFLLNCFIYHINLWQTFLNIVSPAINYLCVVLSVFGMCGFSFQLAMLSDLLVLITIHAHCFYIYAAVLYRLEIVGLRALWRIVLGRRKNVLKNRVESYDYKHSQLFLATLFFSSLLFLLPTVLVYYVVFSTVRLGIYCIIFTLLMIRRRILQLPVYDLMRYFAGIHVGPANIVTEIVEYTDGPRESPSELTVVRVTPQRASINWTTAPMEFDKDYPPIGQFIVDLLKGEIKGFIRPRADD